jgi:hypothetical protein
MRPPIMVPPKPSRKERHLFEELAAVSPSTRGAAGEGADPVQD